MDKGTVQTLLRGASRDTLSNCLPLLLDTLATLQSELLDPNGNLRDLDVSKTGWEMMAQMDAIQTMEGIETVIQSLPAPTPLSR